MTFPGGIAPAAHVSEAARTAPLSRPATSTRVAFATRTAPDVVARSPRRANGDIAEFTVATAAGVALSQRERIVRVGTRRARADIERVKAMTQAILRHLTPR